MPAEERIAFDKWRSDPRNQDALDALHELWGELAVLKYLEPSPLQKARARPALMAVAALLVFIGGLGFAWVAMSPSNRLQTAIGEQRTQPLPDGSIVAVNVASSLTYRFDGDERFVDLYDGEAVFSVKSDQGQPFTVRAGPYEVRATGTSFNVRERGGVVDVSVSEGAVEICKVGAKGNSEPLLNLTAGQAVQLPVAWNSSLPVNARPVRVDEVGQWRARVASYEDTSLADIVTDLNRYFERPIVIKDRGGLGTRLTLRLQLEDRETAIGTLASLLGLSIRENDQASVLEAPPS